MELSIVVVNYNVKYFLQQLLLSIFQSKTNFDYEVIVVDNDSQDGSIPFLKKQFADVRYIENDMNLGFAKANNQGIKTAKGNYILLLNPDTLVQEDTLQKSVDFMADHPNAGAMGVRMVDGGGKYLPESKRGFPTPLVAFFKVFGLSTLFPRSKIFNGYYLGYLPDDQTHSIDVLTGAFMILRQATLQRIGLLDEDFFMYGEDIDLSYRIKKAGYDIFYSPNTSIVHYKGESTNKDSIQYIRQFYKAMQTFALKHYSGSEASVLSLILNAGIYFRAALSVGKRILKTFTWPALDFVCIYLTLQGIKSFWAISYFQDPHYYDDSTIHINFLFYGLIWILTFFVSGVYEKIFNLQRLFRNTLIGAILIIALYSFLGPELRASRAIILLGTLTVILVLVTIRMLWFRITHDHWRIFSKDQKRVLIVGEENEAKKVINIMEANGMEYILHGWVAPGEQQLSGSVGSSSQLDQIVRFYPTDEIIFCSENISSGEIMRWMSRLGTTHYVKIAPAQAHTILGSRDKNSPGDLHTFEVKYNIADPVARRNKRFLDISLTLIFLLSLPIMAFIVESWTSFIQNILQVLGGKRTWVSYSTKNESEMFPPLAPGVLKNT
ncbi:MAG: glycosyltransferase family 2 protein, partial [Saprospiraceae bacterium]|nr:glycosyltransferase family 2 protein [Saprospiraceae bacterium]